MKQDDIEKTLYTKLNDDELDYILMSKVKILLAGLSIGFIVGFGIRG